MYEIKCPCFERRYMNTYKCDETDCNDCCPLALIKKEEEKKLISKERSDEC